MIHAKFWPRSTPPAFVAGFYLRLCASAIEKTARGRSIAWTAPDGARFSDALRAAADALRASGPEWERDSDGVAVGVRGYVPADYCGQVERHCLALMDGWRVTPEEWEAGSGERFRDLETGGAYTMPEGATVAEHMVARVLKAILAAARVETVGDVVRAWQHVGDASFNAGAALAFSAFPLADFDAIAREARAAVGRPGAEGKKAKDAPRKADALALWERWQRGQESFHSFAAFATECERRGYCPHGTALKWEYGWRQEAKAKRKG